MEGIKKRLVHFGSLGAIFLGTIFFVMPASAATLFLTPNAGSLSVGDTVTVQVRVDTGDQGFNSAQATLSYPKNILNVQSIGSSPSDSIFDFWLEDPKFSNEDGTVTFLGGATNGVVGASVPLLKITFVAVGGGQATVAASDAAVTASDGSGTNILSRVSGAAFSVGPATINPVTTTLAVPVPPATSQNQSVVTSTIKVPQIALTEPVQIKRKSVPAKAVPEVPSVTVAVFPDPTKWYNIITNFLAEWNLPPDITDVSTAVNHEPNFTPTASEGLIAAKAFPAVADGIWYLHVRFKNNVGWGSVAHYRIAIDTEPPSTLSVTSDLGLTTDNPSPTLRLKESDGLSGAGGYLVGVDSADFVKVTGDSYTVPLLDPGSHLVTVRALDLAGNIREQKVTFKILPREVPLLVIGGLKISTGVFSSIIFVALAAAFAAGWFLYRVRQKQIGRKVVIAERDVMNIFVTIDKDVDRMLQYYVDSHLDEREAQEMLTYLKKIKDNIKKSQKYILENIKEIGD